MPAHEVIKFFAPSCLVMRRGSGICEGNRPSSDQTGVLCLVKGEKHFGGTFQSYLKVRFVMLLLHDKYTVVVMDTNIRDNVLRFQGLLVAILYCFLNQEVSDYTPHTNHTNP